MPRTPILVSAVVIVGFMAGACGDDREITPVEQAEATSSNDEEGTAAPTSPEDEALLAGEPDPSAGSVRIQLGDRFPWCADVQEVWDAYDQSLPDLRAAEARYQEAVAAYDATPDELDKAEAREIVDAAGRDMSEVDDAYQSAFFDTVEQLLYASRSSGENTESVAHQRAWTALIEESPDTRVPTSATDWESLTQSIQAAILDDEAYTAFRLSLQESCQ